MRAIIAACQGKSTRVATYFGKELLDSTHEEKWTRARAAAEAFKSEAHRYLVQAPPYDGPDRGSRLKARIAELSQVTRDPAPDDITPDRAAEGMPSTWWTVDDYLTKRVQDQIDWYRLRAREHTRSMAKGRAISLTLGGLSVVLGAVTGASAAGATLAAAVLGVVTTAGGSIGAHFQAAHYEAIALKYRETADATRHAESRFQGRANATESGRAGGSGRGADAGGTCRLAGCDRGKRRQLRARLRLLRSCD